MSQIYRALFVICFLSALQASAYSESQLPIQEPKVAACSDKITVQGCPAIAKEFYEWFDPSILGGSLFSCMSKAARKAGYTGNIKKFVLSHKGVHVVKKTNSPHRGLIWSLHSFGRAIDISAVTVRGASGNKTYSYPDFCQKENNSSNINTKFFHRLRQCWSRSLGSAPYGIGAYWASITCEHSAHRGHMHLSLPYAPVRALWNGIAIE